MKRFITTLLTVFLLLMLLAGCENGSSSVQGSAASGNNNILGNAVISGDTDEDNQTSTVPDADLTQSNDAEMFTDRDLRGTYDALAAVTVRLNGNTATAAGDGVSITGSTVEITQAGTYILSGTLEDGTLVVNASDKDKVQLVFSGAHITSQSYAALYVLQADKVFLTLAEGTENSLVSGDSFIQTDENNVDAALFSKQDLTINGFGTLTVTSPAGHGIVSKDDLVITGGTLQVDVASHAIQANDSVRFTGASLTATAGKDGIHCENTDDATRGYVYISGGSMKLEVQGDGISAGYYAHITDGTIDILAGGGYENGSSASSGSYGSFMGGGGRPGGHSDFGSTTSSSSDDGSTSMKGIKAASSVQIDGGTLKVDSADDAIHSNACVVINSGSFTIASGDDAVHGEDTLTVNSGTIRISHCYEGLEALHILVNGGDIELVATDDGLNAAGGTDSSGTGGRDNMFGGHGGGMMSGSSNGSIVISGGKLYINASGDGIDANGTLEITGGYTVVAGPTQGDTATLDYDISAVITGGTFIGTGASGMAQTFSGSEQGVLAVSVGSQSAGTQITLKDGDGNTVISYAPVLSYQVVILSSPDMVSGEAYTITVGSQSATFDAS